MATTETNGNDIKTNGHTDKNGVNGTNGAHSPEKQKVTSSVTSLPRHPHAVLEEKAAAEGLKLDDVKFAEMLDAEDEISHLRNEFFYPKNKDLPDDQGRVQIVIIIYQS